jgi:hypothetical protein
MLACGCGGILEAFIAFGGMMGLFAGSVLTAATVHARRLTGKGGQR